MIKKFTDFINELYSDYDTYNGPNISTWQGDNTGALGSKKGAGGGSIGGEFDSNSDVSGKGERPWKTKHVKLAEEKGKKEEDEKRDKAVEKLDKEEAEKHSNKLQAKNTKNKK